MHPVAVVVKHWLIDIHVLRELEFHTYLWSGRAFWPPVTDMVTLSVEHMLA